MTASPSGRICAGAEQLAVASAAPRAVVLPAAQERRPPGPSRKEIVSAQQERRNFGRRLREGVDPMDPVRMLHHLLPCAFLGPLRIGRITSMRPAPYDGALPLCMHQPARAQPAAGLCPDPLELLSDGDGSPCASAAPITRWPECEV